MTQSHEPRDRPPPGSTRLTAPVFDALIRAVESLQFGVVQIVVHEGRVTQLDVTERQRF